MANLKQNDEDYGKTDSEENKKRGWKLKLAKGKKKPLKPNNPVNET